MAGLLDTFIGSDRQKQTLIALTNNGRLCHALLLTGAEGTGKRTFARLAAAAMLCEGSGTRPCGECPHCRKVMAGTHPDVIPFDCTVKPRPPLSKLDILREQVIDTIPTAPNEAARKVYILEQFERMSDNAPHVLLKSLEEPPPHAAFILTCTTRERIPATILSRVVALEMQPLPDDVLLEALKSRYPEAEPSALSAAAGTAFGSLGAAMATLQDPGRLALAGRCRAALRAFADADEYGLLAALTLSEKDKDAMRVLLRMLVQSARKQRTRRPDGSALRLWTEAAVLFEEAAGQLTRNAGQALVSTLLTAKLMQARLA